MSDRPLAGIRIAVTRARDQADELAAPLRELGAEVLIAPLIRIVPSIDAPPVRTAIDNLNSYQWLVLTSANGVELFIQALRRAGKDPSALARLKVASVGPATTSAAKTRGIAIQLVPEEFTGDALAATLVNEMGIGARVLLARAGGAREELPRMLAEHGAKVDEVELYRSVLDDDGAARLRERLAAGMIDMVTFTSGSTVRYFAEAVGQLAHPLVAVIGPATSEVARRHDVRVDLEANPHTTSGLVSAIAEYYRRAQRPTEE